MPQGLTEMAGIYVHIPFCHSKCAYCDFYSMPLRNEADFVEALMNEYASRKKELAQEISTIYLGGGTPSCLSRSQLTRIFNLLPVDKAEEITIEINPEDATDDFVKWLHHDTLVNRVSMGVQSLNDTELKTIGRRHSAIEAINAAKRLLESGFNLSLDLIYGLPGQNTTSWEKSLDGVLALNPHHLSCYLLSYEPGTRLTAMKQTGKITEISDTEALEMYELLCDKAYSSGYQHYEISNFSKLGFHSRHNSSYWNLTPYLGLGPGAHSFDGKIRRYNPGNLKQYIENKGIGITVAEDENDSERFNDFVITSLRTEKGMSLELCSAMFGSLRRNKVERISERFIKEGIMWHNSNYLGINTHYWLTSDAIMLEFIEI